jgi:hypothetical protein
MHRRRLWLTLVPVLALAACAGGLAVPLRGDVDCSCPQSGVFVALPPDRVAKVTAVTARGTACHAPPQCRFPGDAGPCGEYVIAADGAGACDVEVTFADGPPFQARVSGIAKHDDGCCGTPFRTASGADMHLTVPTRDAVRAAACLPEGSTRKATLDGPDGAFIIVEAGGGESIVFAHDAACETFPLASSSRTVTGVLLPYGGQPVPAVLAAGAGDGAGSIVAVRSTDGAIAAVAHVAAACDAAASELSLLHLFDGSDSLLLRCWVSGGAAYYDETSFVLDARSGSLRVLLAVSTGSFEGPSPDEAEAGAKPRRPAGSLAVVSTGYQPVLRVTAVADWPNGSVADWTYDLTAAKFVKSTPDRPVVFPH